MVEQQHEDTYFNQEEEKYREEMRKKVANQETKQAIQQKSRTIVNYFLGLAPYTMIIGITVGVILYAIVFLEAGVINAWEIRLYVGMGFLFMAVLIFGVLRLYNAVVANSATLLEFRNNLRNYNNEVKKWATNFNSGQSHVGSAMSKLAQVLQALVREQRDEK